MKETYEELLKRAYGQVPKITFDKSRFNVPEPEVIQVGGRTVLRNFKQICSTLNRDERHVMKYLLRELGAAGNISGDQLIVQGRFTAENFKQKIESYLEEFVFCRECHRPDTKLEKQEGILILRCTACGAKTSVRQI